MKYVAAYDTELRECLPACKKIRAVHEHFGFPATFFFVGKRLREFGSEYRQLLGDVREFEFASHTVTHYLLRPHPFSQCLPDATARVFEVNESKRIVEQTFERQCIGFRPAYGFPDGLVGDRELVDLVAKAGYRYVSSLLWGPQCTLPALLSKPFHYGAQGHRELVELPGHGWHDNVLKGLDIDYAHRGRMIAYPSPFPEGAVPLRPVRSAQAEFKVSCLFIEQALQMNLPYISFILHPWSLARFDPEMEMLRLLFKHVQQLGIQAATFAEIYNDFVPSSASFTLTVTNCSVN